ncbi:MAG: polyprenyl synthetase family protein [Bacteroidia bacterium]|nr:polyprenyl synthetase family protein [Bacteroidia bacterium]
MVSTLTIPDKIENALNSIEYSKSPKELYEPISYILSLGGKRIRPTLVLIGCEMFGGDIDQAIDTAIGIEMFHNFTLLHDDIMDNAPLRRSKPTVHEKWNTNIAILSGDTMFIKSVQYISKVRNDIIKDVLSLFNESALIVCEGQQYDMNFEERNDVSIEEYIHMIQAKTATLLACSLKLGAIIGNASDTDAQELYNFGINIGIAFQLKDDLLDVYGESGKFGKQVGGDIIANKKTYLLIKARELAQNSTSEELNSWLESKENEQKVEMITAIYDQLNIRTITECVIDEYYNKAIANLSKVSVEESKKEHLKQLTDKLMVREV